MEQYRSDLELVCFPLFLAWSLLNLSILRLDSMIIAGLVWFSQPFRQRCSCYIGSDKDERTEAKVWKYSLGEPEQSHIFHLLSSAPGTWLVLSKKLS